MIEEWRDIEGYEILYKVSNTGKVIDCVSGKELPTNSTQGYEQVVLKKSGSKKLISVHRLVAKAFIPNPKGLPIINHKDLDRGNNDFRNLEWTTYKGNSVYYQEEKKKGNVAKKKDYLDHIKVYTRSSGETNEIIKFAKSQGMSASAFIKKLAMDEIANEESC